VAYGFTVRYCVACDDRTVSNYITPLGHDYEIIKVEATIDKVGYTKYDCKNCDYSYLSDFVTSGDNGYIEAPPTGGEETPSPDSGENPPDPPDDGENDKPPDSGGNDSSLEDGEQGEEHYHVFLFNSVLKEEDKKIYVEYKCECEEIANEQLLFTFTDEAENQIYMSADENGVVDYAEIIGKYEVEISNPMGEILATYTIEVIVDAPDTPNDSSRPDSPDASDKPEDSESSDDMGNTDSSSDSSNPEQSDSSVESEEESTVKTQNEGLMTGLLITIGVLAVGGIATLFIIKKKNNSK